MNRLENFGVRNLTIGDITPELLNNFHHSQSITKKWVKNNGVWEVTETSLLREWSAEKRIWITEYMCQQIERGGITVFHYDIINKDNSYIELWLPIEKIQ